jgi:YHS domain-containing protein
MGIAMTIPMAAWMRFRGHGWADCGEMSAAMLVPFFALVLPVALGLEIIPGLNPQTLMVPAHGAMIGGMVLLMVYRWDRYAHCHTAAAPVAAGARPASATDPVCGMPVDPTTARTTEHEGQTYRFCSPGCQQSFAQDPARYLAS